MDVNVAVAFTAGLLSFISPCCLPLVPAYLSYITGVSLDEMGNRRTVIPSALAFVLGLTLVLSALGLGVTALGQALSDYQEWMTRIGGALVIVLGLHMAGVVRVPFLYQERRADFVRFRGRGVAGAAMMGGAFGIGWTPCVGPVLTGILIVASQSETLANGTMLLAFYSLGLGVPFVIAALALGWSFRILALLKRHARTVEVVSGSLLVVMGLLLFDNRLLAMNAWIIRVFGTGLATWSPG